ncbi:hypothetical protein MN2019_11930 [Mycolicibacterium neoaurum]|uniref:hypothetical protein n=1 Tax=Mycolicibacterium neoaurum TaxID=1795 RepID=UPI001BCE7AC2|nr:hypothetical protein [Mycolicibacterium neoaurum]QVI29931.1 hypothetical protein MN2019_11930 [Mycolicibacterium neoaurum]
MTRLDSYAQGAELGYVFDLDRVIDTAVQTEPDGFLHLFVEDNQVGVFRFRLTPAQADALRIALTAGLT